MKSAQIQQQKRAARERFFLRVCLFATGASTLVLEIIGTRLISPYYGSSLYCWSALITVTLVSLAIGYHWGGRLADRTPALTLAARLLAGAALSVAACPTLRVPALQAAAPLGIQIGSLVSAMVLVAPALILLSAIGPLAVRLVAESLDKVGRSTGEIYAVSTVGSVLGAVLSGFVLIPNLGLSQILYGIAVLLLLLSTWAHYLSQERLPLAQPAIAAAVALYGFWPRPVAATNILRNEESAYGQVKVMDFAGTRYLLVNGTTQAMASMPDMNSDSQYAHVMELAATARPNAKTGLMIGLGAGLMSGTLERHYGLTMDAVELDPAMERAARDYFRFSPKGKVFIDDGRRFLDDVDRPGVQERYDLIFLDAFGGEAPPFHLFTRESFESLRRRLAPDGVLAINLVSAMQGPDSKPWQSAFKTLAAVFPEVAAYQASKTLEDLGNVVFFAGAGPLPRHGKQRALRPEIAEHCEYALSHPLKSDAQLGVLLTDDFSPMEALLAQTSARWRRQLQSKVSEIMLY